MKKYFLICLLLLGPLDSLAKKAHRVISSEKGDSTTYHFVMPPNTAMAKDFKVTVTNMGGSYLGELKVKLKSGEQKALQMPCYLLSKIKTLRCVREDGGGRFEITALLDAKGDKTYKLRIRHLDLGGEQEELLAISAPSGSEFLEVDGTSVHP